MRCSLQRRGGPLHFRRTFQQWRGLVAAVRPLRGSFRDRVVVLRLGAHGTNAQRRSVHYMMGARRWLRSHNLDLTRIRGPAKTQPAWSHACRRRGDCVPSTTSEARLLAPRSALHIAAAWTQACPSPPEVQTQPVSRCVRPYDVHDRDDRVAAALFLKWQPSVAGVTGGCVGALVGAVAAYPHTWLRLLRRRARSWGCMLPPPEDVSGPTIAHARNAVGGADGCLVALHVRNIVGDALGA